jgi:hypothetical protein
MTEANTLYSKEGFEFVKNAKNDYSLCFQMENNNIILSKVIDFNLVKLIYSLNSDIYEKINIEIINENEAIFNLLIRNLFEDLGLPQRFSYVRSKRFVGENNIKFVSQTIKTNRPDGMPANAELMPLQRFDCNCDIITPHKINFTCNIVFESIMFIPAVAEKLVGLILYKIFKRVKQFIENVRV